MNVPVRPPYEDSATWERLPTYLRQARAPIRQWLAHPQVVEIMFNRPHELWVEILGEDLVRHDTPELTGDAIRRICEQVASYSNQSVNEETPLLSAAMPNGERFQGVLPPASPEGGSLSIRKQVIRDLSLDDYAAMGALDNIRVTGPFRAEAEELTERDMELVELLWQGTVDAHIAFLRKSVHSRVTILASGGTSTGKTTFANALLKEVPAGERLISIEDTRELRFSHPNYTALVASKGDQGLSKATIQSLLEASLRMRPDRLFLGEIRGKEAYSFLQAVNTGHPGSLTTLHADSPLGAFERLGLMTLEAGVGLSEAEVIGYAKFVLPVVVQLTRSPRRGVSGDGRPEHRRRRVPIAWAAPCEADEHGRQWVWPRGTSVTELLVAERAPYDADSAPAAGQECVRVVRAGRAKLGRSGGVRSKVWVP